MPHIYIYIYMAYMYVLYVCLIRMPYLYELHVCLICMPYMYALFLFVAARTDAVGSGAWWNEVQGVWEGLKEVPICMCSCPI